MKVFITGATGFIGSHLADALLEDPQNEVRCLVRSDLKWLRDKGVVPVMGDLHDLPALRKGLEGADVVFHLAALVKAPKPEIFFRTNVEATENIIRMAQKAGVPKMVILSSLAAAGPSFQKPVTEADPLMPVSMYGQSKKEMEEMIHQVAGPRDSVTIIRPPAVYGPREENILSFFKIASRGICPIVGSGKTNRISMVHVADVVQALLLAWDQTETGVHTYFVSGPEVYTWNEIKDATAQALGRKLITLPLPPKVVSLVGSLTESVASLAGSYPIMNRDKAREMTLQWTCSTQKIRHELGFRPVYGIREGLADTISWYRRHRWL